MANLGSRQVIGTHDPSNVLGAGNWTCAFTPQVFNIFNPFEIYHITVKGPSGSTFQEYVDTTFYDNVVHGDINSWDPSQPLFMLPGSTLFFYYSMSVGPAPLVTIFCRDVTS
jgi:hypothetical protein